MTAVLVPEGVSMTARDVLIFKYLGSDYQHKKHFLKRRNKHADTLVITKLTGFCHKNRVAKEKKRTVVKRARQAGFCLWPSGCDVGSAVVWAGAFGLPEECGVTMPTLQGLT